MRPGAFWLRGDRGIHKLCALFVGFAFGAGDITLNLWQEAVMKFKVEWSRGCEGYLDILNVFSSMTPEQRADVGDGVNPHI